MLCDACQRRSRCLPNLFAKQDPQLQQMLERLQSCEMRVVAVKTARRSRDTDSLRSTSAQQAKTQS